MCSLQELARRFSLSFGLDLVKNREAVAAMHKLVLLLFYYYYYYNCMQRQPILHVTGHQKKL